MRIAVSAENSYGLSSRVSPHFGRCPFFVLVDLQPDGTIGHVSTINNPFYGNHAPGQVPAFIHSQGANVMLSGGMGASAVSLFDQYGIEAVTGASGTVEQSLEDYLAGRLRGTTACDHQH